MKALNWVLACMLAGCATMSQAQQPPPATQPATQASGQLARAPSPADVALAGEYELAGVMDAGSGLQLRADGSFEWGFGYGALDLYARGKWQRIGNTVELQVEEMRYPPQGAEMKFDRMRLRIDGHALVPFWPWDMDEFVKGRELGRYERSDEQGEP
ncbi:MAG: hypothetical protein IT472_04425 [Thermomonas sp.]|uniref:hypothetical protein n=1 Tax=Thermomonas sp. TaxID=1971895 RepID=UPI00261C57A5|nr:hypothetical protein [Thermomonas sp.]MCC7096410.1 hypothetical protein [Thermomonas sp.]